MGKAIEETIRDTQGAPESSVVIESDKDIGESTATVLSAGYTYIYDSRTGDRSVCNNNMLSQHLKKKRADGSYVFTTQRPKKLAKRGTLKCMLHPDNSKRTYYNELGLATCLKDNLTSPFQVTRHMQKRHKMEWQTIEQERVTQEKQEEREFRQKLMNKEEKAPLYISDKDKTKNQ